MIQWRERPPIIDLFTKTVAVELRSLQAGHNSDLSTEEICTVRTVNCKKSEVGQCHRNF